MGLTLHYSARLRRPEQLPELCDEITDICESLHWPCRPVDMTFDAEPQYVPDESGDGKVKQVPLRGVVFTPPECETVSLTFTPTWRLSSAMNLKGRRLSDGLHQAIEAKERVKIQPENVTLASDTFQNNFRLY